MVTTRVTQNLIADRTLNDINQLLGRISTLQEQLATGQRVNRPSDDPIDARRAISIRALISENEQFLSNISDIQPQVQESGTTILDAVANLQRVLELTTQGANEVNAQDQLDSIALEIDGILEGVFALSNTRSNNRTIFSGSRTLADAFSATRVGGEITAVTYDGNTSVQDVNIADGVTIGVNLPGSDVFQSNVDVFDLLIGIRDDLRAGDQANLRNVRLDDIREALDQLLFSEARVGSIQNRLDRTASSLEGAVIEFEQQLSDKVDADFSETILNLNVSQNAFQAALNAGGRIIQPSLLNFLA